MKFTKKILICQIFLVLFLLPAVLGTAAAEPACNDIDCNQDPRCCFEDESFVRTRRRAVSPKSTGEYQRFNNGRSPKQQTQPQQSIQITRPAAPNTHRDIKEETPIETLEENPFQCHF
uniref:Uncharacterized protein n=1 Tax=Stomoxys calcitrans TaxID=35570 RepID=A0A1I8P9Q1_STOCA